jgi:hypothetical protein
VQVLPASYVKFIESAGGEVVPLPQQIQFEDSTVSAKLEGPKFTKREREKESERERDQQGLVDCGSGKTHFFELKYNLSIGPR